MAAYTFRGETIDLYQCPSKAIDPAILEVASLFPWCESGTWPNSGGILDQPGWFVRARAIFEAERVRLQREDDKKMREEAERGRG